MDDKIVFKTATVGGFEKKAVTDYIYQMNEDNEYAQQQLKSQIAKLETLIKTLHTEKEQAEQAALSLRKELDSTSQRVSSKNQQQAKLSSLSDELSREIDGLSKSLQQQNEENIALRQRNTDLERRCLSLEEQRDDIERTTAQLGRVMLEARTDADQVLAEAKNKAQTILQEAEQTVATQYSAQQEQADLLVEDAQKEAEEILADAKDFAQATRTSAKEETQQLIENTRQRVADMLRLGDTTRTTTQEHLSQLGEQSQTIEKTIEQVFESIQEQSRLLGEFILSTGQQFHDNDDLAQTAQQLKVPELTHEDVQAILKAREPKTGATIKGDDTVKDTKDISLEKDILSPLDESTEKSPTIINLAGGMTCGEDGCAVPDLPAQGAVCDETGCALPEDGAKESPSPLLELSLDDDTLGPLDDSFSLHDPTEGKE